MDKLKTSLAFIQLTGKHTVLDMLREQWIPYEHCSNCRYCVVYRSGDETEMAHCQMGYGPDKILTSLIRPSHARGWKQAKDCPSYMSMDD